MEKEVRVRREYERHGESRTRLYSVWWSMISRCRYTNRQESRYYSKKGIRVCEEWSVSYLSFKRWAEKHGYRDTLMLDRIDNSKGYSPENCRFVGYFESNRNRTANHILEIFGEKKTVQDWAQDDRCVVNAKTFASRIFRKWPNELALRKPRVIGRPR